MKRINCFIPFQDADQVRVTVENLKAQNEVNRIYLVKSDDAPVPHPEKG